MRHVLPWRDEPEMMRTGHWAYVVIPALSAIFVANDIRQGRASGPLGFIAYLGGLATFFCLWALWCEVRVHGRRLCEKCAESVPAAPQLAVARWRPALWLVHSRLPYTLLAAQVLIWLPATILRMDLLAWDLQAALAVIVAAFFVAARKHSILQPWCPWCDWGHGGDEEISPGVPSPEMSK